MTPVARLTWRVAAFELKALLVTATIITVGSWILVTLLGANAPSTPCVAAGTACDDALFAELGRRGGQLMVAMAFLPIAVGGILGSQLFAREIERGTAQLPWSLAASRVRWYLERVTASGFAVVLIVVIPAVASMALEGAINPGVDPARSLLDFGLRGPSVVARSLAVFVVSSVVGLAVGRVLPALILSVVVGAALVALIHPLSLAAQPTELIAPLGDPQVRYGVVRDERYQDAAGLLYPIDEVMANVPSGTGDPAGWIASNYRQVAIGVRGEHYWDAEMTSTAILTVVTALALALGALISRGRRPI